MRGMSQGATLALAVHFFLGLSLGATALAQSPEENSEALGTCQEGQHLQVTLAMPREYFEAGNTFRFEDKGDRKRQVCASYAVGTTYQLLSWLENGAVQAAALPDFAIAIMQADGLERFRNDYYILPLNALPGVPNVERRLLLFDAASAPLDEPYARLDKFFEGLRGGEVRESIFIPSHLSPALPYLIRYAIAWTDRVALEQEKHEAFFGALLKSIRFSKQPQGTARQPDPAPVHYQLVDILTAQSATLRPSFDNEVKPDPELELSLADHIVVRKRVLIASRELRGAIEYAKEQVKQQGYIDAPPESALFAKTLDLERGLGESLTRYRESNYRRLQFGAVAQRHFRFTIPELWELLQALDPAVDTQNPYSRNLALVLTGGGVKAAYQTKVIDYLYDQHRLVNRGSDIRESFSQQVDYVIGTSGGALLGVFVAAMDQPFDAHRRGSDNTRLTSILWKEPGVGLRSFDVFPFLDMMRYASFIVALVVVWMVSVVMLAVFQARYPQVTRLDHAAEGFFGRRARAWKESWPWIALLLLAPIAIIKVASVNRIEHMPTETGLYYAWMALVTFYSDVRLNPLQPFAWRHARLNWITVVLLLAGAALVSLALWRSGPLAEWQDKGMLFVNLCGLGFVVLTHALNEFFHAQTAYFQPEPRARIFGAFGVLLGVVLLGYLGVVGAMTVGVTSLLEMNGGFWMYFLLSVALITVAFLWWGSGTGDVPARAWARNAVGFMFSEYRSRAMFGSERRFMRFVSITVIAWLFWNMLAAPALYGNHNARRFLDQAFGRFANVQAGESPDKPQPLPVDEDPESEGTPFRLTVPFVITATSLEKGQERYFLFVSGEEEKIDASLPASAWFNVVRDPRWVVVRQPMDKEIQSAAFASGSPFPVFSAHDVKLRLIRANERLIDGGFAHNKPLEAAAALGARKVLVLNSSPLEAASGAGCSLLTFNIGELFCNLPKLLPYLWERSQVEDLLTTRRLVVASIYPTAASGSWPSLTDFRKQTVSYLVKYAESDVAGRVGVIEGWGAPRFGAPGLLGYDEDAIKGAVVLAERTR